MPVKMHSNRPLQLVIGFVAGIPFGFLLQKGGVTDYDVIIGQLLLKDFTVLKIMLTAVIVGTIGVHLLKSLKLAELKPKPGSFGATVIGGLIFGLGFGTLGYCPGTVAGAVGQGALDALLGGVTGILIGAGAFAAFYPVLNRKILNRGYFGELTFPKLLKVNHWAVVIPGAVILIVFLIVLEKAGL